MRQNLKKYFLIILLLALPFIYYFLYLQSKMNRLKKPLVERLFNEFIFSAHRGTPLLHPENSLESFREAKKINPNALLETDLYMTSDGVIVLSHNAELDILTNGIGFIRDKTWNEIKDLDLGYKVSFDNNNTFPFRSKGYKIVKFEDFLIEFQDSLISIDVKEEDLAMAKKVGDLLRKYNMQNKALLASFSKPIQKFFKKNYSEFVIPATFDEVLTFFILDRLFLGFLFFTDSDVFIVPQMADSNNSEYFEGHTFPKLVRSSFVKTLKSKNIPVMVWTINKKDNMRELLKLAVNSVFTDDLPLLMETYNERER